MSRSKSRTSWEESSKWYDKLVGQEGHYYHQKVILPKTLPMLGLKSNNSLLDIGCGQGILAKAISPEVKYLGLDASGSLIESARKTDKNKNHSYILHDATKPKKLTEDLFSHAAAILCLQNMANHQGAIELAALNLKVQGSFIIVLNHPCFRIPRQSGWETFASNKLQYRWLTKYLSGMEIPMQTFLPGGKTVKSVSFHEPISVYTKAFKSAGFLIEDIQEWISDKESSGPNASKENRARAEFPLFMAIKLVKI